MKKKSRKLLIIIGAVVGILFGAILLGISPLAKYYVEKHGKELIGRRVSVDQLRFNLLNGKLHIEDFTLYEADEKSAFVALDRFSTDVKLWSLLKRTININYIDLVRPDIHITQHAVIQAYHTVCFSG